jgi:hypothetical protein
MVPSQVCGVCVHIITYLDSDVKANVCELGVL